MEPESNSDAAKVSQSLVDPITGRMPTYEELAARNAELKARYAELKARAVEHEARDRLPKLKETKIVAC